MCNFGAMTAAQLLRSYFPLTPTPQQDTALERLSAFVTAPGTHRCFILKGYAGTGKTTLISTLVKALPRFGLQVVLMAPTGRAAKVMSTYSGKQAFTIHKKIYRKKSAVSPDMSFVAGTNRLVNTVFIVDEASMISNDRGDFSGNSLLHDLVNYVFNGEDCRLLLVGDTAQLPPVHSASSPALDEKLVAASFGLDVRSFEMTDVIRQQKASGILFNATRIREMVTVDGAFPELNVRGFGDIYRMTGEKLEEGLHYAYNKHGIENCLVICRSNKSANNYNQQIRNRILYREEELTGGDYLMVVRNNYFWLQQNGKSTGFIANGDIARVRKVRNVQELYGFRFADVVLELVDYPDEEPLTCKVLLDTLTADTPNLSAADHKRLFEAVMEDADPLASKQQRMEELKLSPYFNALQIKFSYAVTCHKAQGGQWEAVFVDQGFLTEEMVDQDFLRWLYTAVTRAVKELFLVNFSDQFFKG